MTDQYTEMSFNAGETLKASQLNTVVQNINIVNTQVKNINTSINEINTVIAGKADKPAGNENYATETYVDNSIAAIPATDLSNYYTKSETDNKINAAKPNLSSYATQSYVDDQIADLVNSAPEALDTLNELANALGADPNFATTIATEIGKKVDNTTTINNKTLNTNITLTAADVGALPNTTVIPSIAGLATENYVNTKVTAITTGSIGAAKASDLTTLQTNLETLQTSLNLSGGALNRFAVSNGNGGIAWLEIPLAENTTY